MLQQTTIPKTPEEIAACLAQMPKEDQCVVKGIIIGLSERMIRTTDAAPRPEPQT